MIDQFNRIQSFLQVAETRSFVAAGRSLGVSASAVGKSIARLEQRLGVRLFHRSTRSVTLTAEGAAFLERCRRIVSELEAAEAELLQTSETARGKLRVSLPLVSMYPSQVFATFLRRYPEIELELDYTDRLVDVIEEGFDAVIRTGAPRDSRLMSRALGSFRQAIVGAPEYFKEHGFPSSRADLEHHAGLLYRFPSTGKIQVWGLDGLNTITDLKLRSALVSNAIDTLVCMAEQGLGIACLPEFAVREKIEAGNLCVVLQDQTTFSNAFQILWPSGRNTAPKLRVLIEFLAQIANNERQ